MHKVHVLYKGGCFFFLTIITYFLLPSSPEVDFTDFFFPRDGKKKPPTKFDLQISAETEQNRLPIWLYSPKLGKTCEHF